MPEEISALFGPMTVAGQEVLHQLSIAIIVIYFRYDINLFMSELSQDGKYLAMVTERKNLVNSKKREAGIVVWDLHQGNNLDLMHCILCQFCAYNLR